MENTHSPERNHHAVSHEQHESPETQSPGLSAAPPTFQLQASPADAPMQRQVIQAVDNTALVPYAIEQVLLGAGVAEAIQPSDERHAHYWVEGSWPIPPAYHNLIWNVYKAVHWTEDFGRTAAEWAQYALEDLHTHMPEIEAACNDPAQVDALPGMSPMSFDGPTFYTNVEQRLFALTSGDPAAPAAGEAESATHAGAPSTVPGLGGFPSDAEIETNMGEFTVDNDTDDHLFINSPALLSGLGWSRAYRPGYAPLPDARDRIVRPAYDAWRANPADPALRAAFDAAMQRFETEAGAPARAFFIARWEERNVGEATTAAPHLTAMQAVLTNLTNFGTAVFPGGVVPAGGITWSALTVTNWEQLRARGTRTAWFDGLIANYNERRERTAIGNALNLDRLGDGQANRHATLLAAVATKVNALRDATTGDLNSRDTTRLQTKLTAARNAVQAMVDFYTQVQPLMTAHRASIARATDRLRDPNLTPLLIPVERRIARITHGDYQMNFRTYNDNAFAAYGDTFNQTGGIDLTRAARRRAEAAPEAVPSGGGGGATGTSPAAQRALRAFNSLRAQGVGESPSRILAAVSGGEGNFTSTQALDRARFSWGFIQYTGGALMSLMRHIRAHFPDLFRQYFERYGITILARGERPGGTYGPDEVNTGRHTRVTSGDDNGHTDDAGDTSPLLVYDHTTHEWVQGHEAMAVIQGDPRYQMLFAEAATREVDIQMAQMFMAQEIFVERMRNASFTFGSGDTEVTLRANQFIHNEIVMFAMISRAIGGGTEGVIANIRAFINASGIAPDDIEAESRTGDFQQRMAAAMRNAPRGETNVAWTRADYLVEAGLPALRDSSYVE